MMDKFRNKYRIETTRLKHWDYGWNAAYFVTICTKNRKCYFGDITDGKIQLSDIGLLAKTYWNKIPQHFPFVILDAFVVMPNHIHGIIIINKSNDNKNDIDIETQNVKTQNLVSLRQIQNVNMQNFVFLRQIQNIKTQDFASLRQTQSCKNKFGSQSKNLASIIRGFKIGVTKNARKIHSDFGWQTRYYDHIIRNTISFEKIRAYIINNPTNWGNDKFSNNREL